MVVDCPTQQIFQREMANAKGKLVVVDFYATWCGPCKQIAPVYESLSQKYKNEAHFLKVDVDQNSECAQKAGVTAMPSFGFYSNGELLELMRGADPRGLEEKIKTLSVKYTKQKSAFTTGSGYSLSGPSTSSSTPSSSTATSQASADRPVRKNPWADANFFPGKGKTTATAQTTASPTAPTSSTTPARPTNLSAHLPATNSTSSQSTPSATVDVPMSDAFNDVPAAVQAAAQSTSSPNSSLPIGLSVNPNLLSQLTDMGFGTVRAEKALLLTKNNSVDSALAWLLEHQDDHDIDEPLQIVASATSSTSVANDEVDLANLDEDERVLYEEVMKKNRADALTNRSMSSSSAPKAAVSDANASNKKPVSEMTSEEKMKWLENRKKEVAEKRAAEAIQKDKESYKSTKGMTQALNDLKEQREEYDRKMAIERRKKEDAAKLAHRRELQIKLAEDKKRRQEEFDRNQEEIRRIREAKAKAGK